LPRDGNPGHDDLLQEIQALRHSEASLRDFVESATIGLHSVSGDGTVLWANQAELDLLGYKAEEYIGYPIAEFHADADVIEDILARLNRGETVREYPARLRSKDGSFRHVVINSSALFEDGRLVHTRCFTRDITDRKKAEERLKEQSSLDALAARVGRHLVENANLPDMLRHCTDAIVEQLKAATARIWTLNEAGDLLDLQADSPIHANPAGSVPATVPLGSNFRIGRIATERKPLLLTPVLGNPCVAEQEWAAREGIVSFAGYPLVVEDRLVGVIGMFCRHALSDIAVQAIARLADQIAVGIERKRVEAALRDSESRLATELSDTRLLHTLSTALMNEESAESLYTKIVDVAAAIMRSDMASMQVVDEAENALRMLAFRGFDEDFGTTFRLNRPDTRTSCSMARRAGCRIIVPDVETCEFIIGTPALQDHRNTGIRAVQSTPLISRSGKMVGMISTHWRAPHQPTERELRLMDIVARHAADLIERKQAEEALRESEGRLHEIVEALPAAIYTTDAEGRIKMFNKAAIEFSGRVPKVDRDSWCVTWKLYWPDGTPLPHDQCPMAIALKEGRPVNGYEAIAERPDGTRRNFMPFPTPLYDASGKLKGAVNMLVDITDRKQAEAASRQTEERLRAIFNSSAVGVAVLTPDARFLQVNKAFCSITGYSEAELQALDCVTLTHPDDCARMRLQIEQLLAGDIQTFVIEKRYFRKDGKMIWVQSSVSLTRDAGNQPANIIALLQDITERKQAEEALRESQAQLAGELADSKILRDISAQLIEQGDEQALYDKIVDAVADIMGSDFATLQMFYPERGPKGELRLLASRGLTPEGQKHWEWVRFDTESTCGQALRTGKRAIAPNVETSEFLAGTGGGAALLDAGIHAAQSTPLFSRSGSFVGMISSHWRNPHTPAERDLRLLDILARQAADMMERKRAEEALRKSQAQLQSLVNHAPLGIYLVDAALRIRQVNPTALPTFADVGDLIGRDFGELMRIMWPREIADEIVGRFYHTRDTGESYRIVEFSQKRTDRQTREYYDWQIHRIILADGQPGVVCYFSDVSAHVSARQAIANSEARLRFMAESMPQKIFTATPTGEVDYFNQQWMDFTGLSFDEIRDWGWRQFIHPDDVEENVRLWKYSIQTGEPFQFVHRFRRADGIYRWHLSRAHCMRGVDGRISMWIGSNTDIHEEKQTEEELRRANEDLNLFAFAASHDLQEPLRMITSYSQLLVQEHRGAFDDDAEMLVGYIGEGTKRMRELLADLLAYTAVGAEQEPTNDMIDLNIVLGNVLMSLRPVVTENGATITCEPLPQVRGAEVHFAQLFQNLIGNALNYRSARPPVIHISVEQFKGEWRFKVSDNGIGIAPEYHEKVFAVFKRLHGKKIPGTGVGLAICKRVVERQGGRIWIESQPGHGSTFCFTLPRKEGESR
jgi:PAS domain S-box-containing protein